MNNPNTIIRQLKIDLITDTPNQIIEWFNDIWDKLLKVEANVYHQDGSEFIYYIEDGKKQWIFYQDNENDRFWCNYKYYWSILEDTFNLESSDIQSITRFLVDNALDNSVTIPELEVYNTLRKVENALYNSVLTPVIPNYYETYRVDNALKSNISTPISKVSYYTEEVENALNNTKSS